MSAASKPDQIVELLARNAEMQLRNSERLERLLDRTEQLLSRRPLRLVPGPEPVIEEDTPLPGEYTAIAEEVLKQTPYRLADLLKPSRRTQLARARHRVMALLYFRTGLSLHDVGDLFGKDHTTVSYAKDLYPTETHCLTGRRMEPKR